MSLLADIEAKAKSLAADFENVDHEALDVLERVQANPATAEAYGIIGQLTHLPPEDLASAVGMLRFALTALGGHAADGQPA